MKIVATVILTDPHRFVQLRDLLLKNGFPIRWDVWVDNDRLGFRAEMPGAKDIDNLLEGLIKE